MSTDRKINGILEDGIEALKLVCSHYLRCKKKQLGESHLSACGGVVSPTLNSDETTED